MSVDPAIIKRSELRKAALEERAKIPESIREAYSYLIRKKVIDFIDSISAKTVHTYIGFGSEVSTIGIIEDLFERKIEVIVPVVQGDKMIHSSIKDLENLHPGSFGVPEPLQIKEVSADKADAVIIPIVAFDGFGMRLGYGKGFYDRFLSILPTETRRLGIAFSVQEVDEIPILTHDKLISYVFTEQSDFFFRI